MKPDVLLTKCLTLLYRESELLTEVNGSEDMVRTAVEKMKIGEAEVGLPTKRDTTLGMKNLVLDLCNRKERVEIDKTELLQHLKILTGENIALYDALVQGIEPEMPATSAKRMITNLRKSIEDYFRETKAAELSMKIFKDLNYNRHQIPDMTAYLRNAIQDMEVLATKATSKNAGVVKSVNFEEDEEMATAFNDVLEANDSSQVFVTGWRELNEALQGGPRPGDCMEAAAGWHGYKSSWSLTVFAHIAIFNKPKCKDPNKKPLLYSVSFEDPLRNNLQFLYQLLKYEETEEPVDIKNVSVSEMWKFVQARMRATGYHVIMEEVNPLTWTHQDLINRMIELEADGYFIEVLRTDYLSKLSTAGCRQGSIGDDIMDQLSRVRSFCLAQGALFINVRQLSTAAIALQQNLPADQFLNHIKGQGMYEGSKGIGRITDIGVLLHRCETDNGTYLHTLIDKHRFPSVVDSKLKSFFLKMPDSHMPVPSNLLKESYKVLRKIPRTRATADDDFFA